MIRPLLLAALLALSLPAQARSADDRPSKPGAGDASLLATIRSWLSPTPQRPQRARRAVVARPGWREAGGAPATAERVAGCGGQRVTAAYYAQGRRTASGEAFNPQAMTAAHRTLPFGTRLTVTNPRTGRSVGVTINDRGPFVRGIAIDLSLGAARAIGLTGTGAVCLL